MEAWGALQRSGEILNSFQWWLRTDSEGLELSTEGCYGVEDAPSLTSVEFRTAAWADVTCEGEMLGCE